MFDDWLTFVETIVQLQFIFRYGECFVVCRQLIV